MQPIKLAIAAGCLVVAIAPSILNGSFFKPSNASTPESASVEPGLASPSPAQDNSDTIQRVYQSARPAVVYVQCKGGGEQGSGVIIDSKGYIVTNAHVVDECEQYFVRLSTGQEFDVKITAMNHDLDLAMLWIPVQELNLPAIRWQSDFAQAKPGEMAIAIGNPWGQEGVVTSGIVNQSSPSAVQIDARVNPGNSGGALLNESGDLIGVVFAVNAQDERIGLAISSAVVKQWIEGLRR